MRKKTMKKKERFICMAKKKNLKTGSVNENSMERIKEIQRQKVNETILLIRGISRNPV